MENGNSLILIRQNDILLDKKKTEKQGLLSCNWMPANWQVQYHNTGSNEYMYWHLTE